MSKGTQSEYVAREFEKWSERYEISFEQEFLIKSLIDLQRQFIETPDDHVRTRQDVLNMIIQIQSRLRLENKAKNNKE